MASGIIYELNWYSDDYSYNIFILKKKIEIFQPYAPINIVVHTLDCYLKC